MPTFCVWNISIDGYMDVGLDTGIADSQIFSLSLASLSSGLGFSIDFGLAILSLGFRV